MIMEEFGPLSLKHCLISFLWHTLKIPIQHFRLAKKLFGLIFPKDIDPEILWFAQM